MATKPTLRKSPAKKKTATKSIKKDDVNRATSNEATFDKETIKNAIVRHLHCTLGTDENKANNHAWWKAACAAINEQVLERLRTTQKTHYFNDTRAVHYFSVSFSFPMSPFLQVQ